jgi:PKD repeat protein
VTLTVTDNLGLTAMTTRSVTVVAATNQAPSASFTATPASVAPGAVVALNASGSVDPDGTIANYSWNFGDGSAVVSSATASTSKSYAAAGSYTVTLTVTDNLGLTAMTTRSVTVAGAGGGGGGVETVWLQDGLPAGATSDGNEPWNWVVSNPAPFAGTQAHQSVLAAGMHQHYFTTNTSSFVVNSEDVLFAYVYLDAANPPSQVMLQWNDASGWEHRAYWGTNLIGWGTNGTASARPMGVLPPTGQWVRLEVPAALVGLEGKTVKGRAFTLYNGRATWDHVGKVSP